MDSQDDKTKQNYALWLRHIKEERGLLGVIDETYGLYVENRLLRAELRQARSAPLPTEQRHEPPAAPPDEDDAAQGDEDVERSTEVIYRYLLNYFDAHKVSPSIREIAAACGLSPKTASRRLERLESEGRIRRRTGARRGIRLVRRQE